MTKAKAIGLPQITLICPALNEATGIVAFLQQMDLTLSPLVGEFGFQVVVVDDGSTDGTAERVREYQPAGFQLVLCQLSRNFGKEAAIQAGLEGYCADAVIIVDADLQHPLDLIPEMLRQWQAGVAIVEAVKSHRGQESVLYRWASRLFYQSLKTFCRLSLHGQSDYKLLDAAVVKGLLSLPERIRFFRGLVHWAGFSRVELPFVVQQRHSGASSWSVLHLLRYSVRNLTAFTSAPLYLITLLGLLMLVLSLVIGAHTLWLWSTGAAVTGFTTVILLLLLIGSLLLISLGIIGLYIARIYEEVKARPLYFVAQVWHSSQAADKEASGL